MIVRLVKLAISIPYFLFFEGFALIFRLFKKETPRKTIVLMYHSIVPEKRLRFERHMGELIKIGYVVRADSTDLLKNNQRHIAVTFDDGFVSVLDNALPVLVERQIPATIFIATGYMGKRPGWITNQKHEYADETVLTEDQLRQLPYDFISVGSHTVTHPYLENLQGDKAIKELVDSKIKLEEILHREINLLSLPYGSFSKDIAKLSKEAGYKRLFLNVPSFSTDDSGQYTVGRIHVSLDDWLIEYRLKLLGAYQWLPFAIAAKRKIIHTIQSFL